MQAREVCAEDWSSRRDGVPLCAVLRVQGKTVASTRRYHRCEYNTTVLMWRRWSGPISHRRTGQLENRTTLCALKLRSTVRSKTKTWNLLLIFNICFYLVCFGAACAALVTLGIFWDSLRLWSVFLDSPICFIWFCKKKKQILDRISWSWIRLQINH